MQWLKRQLKGAKKQENISINTNNLKKELQRVKNWKTPGPDGLQGYWMKAFTACNERIAVQLQLGLGRLVVSDLRSETKSSRFEYGC